MDVQNTYSLAALKIALCIGVFFIFSNLMPVIKVFGVPYTLQTICIMFIPFVLSMRELLIWYVSLLVLTALGLPLMSHFTGGMAVFQGMTAGFIYGWLLQVVLIKYYTQPSSSWMHLVDILFLTTVLDVACGAFWNIAVHGQPMSILVKYCMNLLPFGLVKVLITIALIKCCHRFSWMNKLWARPHP